MANLMIVDDDADFAAAAAKVLQAAGHDVGVELETGAALARMEQAPPDLVVLDVMFPEDNAAGFELARQIRREGSPLAQIPILMLTAINVKFPLGFGSQDIDDVWLPVDDFLEKPVDLDVLQQKVTAMLAAAP